MSYYNCIPSANKMPTHHAVYHLHPPPDKTIIESMDSI